MSEDAGAVRRGGQIDALGFGFGFGGVVEAGGLGRGGGVGCWGVPEGVGNCPPE